MNNINDNNDFETYLRNSIEDFRMTPSRKIWYGIYNNMHPDRKWPSIAVCLIILTAIMYLGVANNNSINNTIRKNTQENLVVNKPTQLALNKKIVNNYKSTINNNIENNDLENNETLSIVKKETTTKKIGNKISIVIKNGSISTPTSLSQKEEILNSNTTFKSNNNNENLITGIEQNNNEITNDVNNKNTRVIENSIITLLPLSNLPQSEPKLLSKNKNIILEGKKSNDEQTNKTKYKNSKLRESGSMAYYFTPSIGFRTLEQSKINKLNTSTAFGRASSNIQNEKVDLTALNLEIGAAFQYKISKNLLLKTGLQANYTNYISKVTLLDHPTQTTLAVSTTQNNSRASSYNTKPGSTQLNKTNWQISLPIGVDIKIAGNNKLKWYIGATAQPTYVIRGNAYVLSADANNYISENNLLRKWNVNTAVETFLSFKPSATVTLNVGPQFRYQLLSSYKSNYNYTEKLYNAGIKIGIVTGL